MSLRVSHSLLDPILGPRLKALYPALHIPRWFPPEGIVLIGHLSAILGAIGFAFSTTTWWGGILGCLGVVGNHTADCVDGTHARTTGQCRNGGELLDHFTDPLSFAYILIGLAVAIGRLDFGIAAVCCLFATAVLTNIKAKMTGEFTLATFGPTEFKTALAISGLVLSLGTTTMLGATFAATFAFWGYAVMLVAGIAMLLHQLAISVKEVNQSNAHIDTQEWITREDLNRTTSLNNPLAKQTQQVQAQSRRHPSTASFMHRPLDA
ncbi:CDP-alcohol phosphatidyltransferase family protein [Neorhodopirellula lusitana]|uniref:CDP-alcohol phosphatidyltransferase family protein n=1 Tax=Neorhodopirellula lusitana TaxID=445327 RepID=UPI00384A86CE